MSKALLLTVGTGTVDKLEETLIVPFRRSFEAGEWDLVVLFPSKETEKNAFLLKEKFPQYRIEVRALREPKLEDNADECFKHFDGEIRRLCERGFVPANITLDITRGTKAMSAALLMAAAAHGVGNVRYLAGGQRDERGMVVPGTEIPSDISLHWVFQRRRVTLGIDYLKQGNFAAVEALFPGAPRVAYPGYLREEIQWLGFVAQFWGAWDRFDYLSANTLAKRAGMPAQPPAFIEPFLPGTDQTELLGLLASAPPPDAEDNVRYCRALAADLLANAERRLREGKNEEVLVRIYRVLELMGQLRLFAHGIDTSDLPREHPVVSRWLGAIPDPPRPDRQGRLQVGREKAAELLAEVEREQGTERGREIAAKLVDLSWLKYEDFGPRLRNTSILLHGFKARTRGREDALKRVYQQVRDLFASEHGSNPKLLQAAGFRFLNGSA